MKNSDTTKHVFFVDDDQKLCKMVGRTFEQAELHFNCFNRAIACLKQLRYQTCDLLITDVKMPEMDGIELLAKAKLMFPSLPVLIVTGYGDIPLTKRAFKLGASDFIQKPIERDSFLSVVKSTLKRNDQTHSPADKMLTKTETEILHFILMGKSTKEIARLRYRSIRTIEEERRHVMHKLNVDNLIDLVKKTTVIRIPEPLNSDNSKDYQ
jgi:FixJ family two-component response regulator